MADDATRHRTYESGPPYSVENFLDLRNQDLNRLDVRRLQKIKDYDTEGTPPNFVYKSYLTVWVNFWLHCGGRMAGGTDAVIAELLDLTYIRCWEEVPYVHRLLEYLRRIMDPNFPLETITMNDRICFMGRFDHMYLYNRRVWGKDLFDESRLRSRPTRDSRAGHDYRPYFWGWNMLEFHEFRHRDKAQFYMPVPEWWLTEYSSHRCLCVPTPLILVYAQGLFAPAPDGLFNELWNMARIEFTITFVLSFCHAAKYGVHRNCNGSSDRRLDESDGGEYRYHGRLFKIPTGVVSALTIYHPFYILETANLDFHLGFLALRRAMEIIIYGEGQYVQYHYDSGETGMLNPYYANGRDHSELTIGWKVQGRSTVGECRAAWKRFQELTEGHRGRQTRLQSHLYVTQVMNEEGYGILSPAILANADTQRTRDPDIPTTPPINQPYNDHVEQVLNDWAKTVSDMPPEAEDGGLSTVIGQPHQMGPNDVHVLDGVTQYAPIVHPGRTMSVTPPVQRPSWWPIEETEEDTKTALDKFNASLSDVGMDKPATLVKTLEAASQTVTDLVSARAVASRVQQAEKDLTTSTTLVNKLEEDVATLRGQVQQGRNERSRLNLIVSRTESEKKDLQDKLNDATEDANKHAQALADATDTRQQLTAAEARVESLEKEMQADRDHQTQVLANLNTVSTTQLGRLESIKANTDRLQETLQEVFDAHDGQPRTRSNAILATLRDLSKTIMESHREDVDTMFEALRQAREALDRNDDVLPLTAHQVNNLRDERDRRRTEAEAARKQRDDLTIRAVSAENKLTRVETDLTESHARIESVQQDLASTRSRVEDLEKDKADLETKATRLRNTGQAILDDATVLHQQWVQRQSQALREANASQGSPSTSDSPLRKRRRI